jgi:DNA (cytosine-5)-methyltransferase 1
MGGLSYAAQKIGLSVWAGVDISAEALNSYKYNFPKATTVNGDLEDIAVVEQIEKVAVFQKNKKDKLIIVSGPPCQGFSVVGSRIKDDPRNKVIISVAKAIARIKPDAALIENVPAIHNAIYSATVKRFRRILNTAGYRICCIELNAYQFGVPQNRRRAIHFILPFGIEKNEVFNYLKGFHRRAQTVKETLANLPNPPLRPLNYDPIQSNTSLPNHYSMRHTKNVILKIASIKPGKGPLSYRKLDPESYAATLISGHRAPPVHYDQPRSITVREALRLQGFPDSFRIMGQFANQMTQVTNAVPAPLGVAGLSVIVKFIGEKQ